MTELAQSLQTAVLDRPVINQTRIEGRFDFTLDWMPDETQFATFGTPNVPDTESQTFTRHSGSSWV